MRLKITDHKTERILILVTYHSFVSIQSTLRGCFVAASLTNVRLVALVHRVVVGDQRRLLSGLVVAQLAGERLLVEMNNFVMDLKGFVCLEFLTARFTHINLKVTSKVLYFQLDCKIQRKNPN